jgi:DNA-binding LacI/PurR family transcriptional regulator
MQSFARFRSLWVCNRIPLAFPAATLKQASDEPIVAAMTEPSPPPVERVRTIADLARIAGVSTGTVSRALSGSSLVRSDTRDRLVKLAQEHGFTPNATARNLRTQRTGAIAVVVPLGHETSQHLSDPFFMALIGHLADALSERGYDLLLSRVIPQRPNWLQYIVDAGRADGLIVIGQSDQADIVDDVAARYLPMVVWGLHRQSSSGGNRTSARRLRGGTQCRRAGQPP